MLGCAWVLLCFCWVPKKNWPVFYFRLPVSFQNSDFPIIMEYHSVLYGFSQPCQNFSDLVDVGFSQPKKPVFDVFQHHYVRVTSSVRHRMLIVVNLSGWFFLFGWNWCCTCIQCNWEDIGVDFMQTWATTMLLFKFPRILIHLKSMADCSCKLWSHIPAKDWLMLASMCC